MRKKAKKIHVCLFISALLASGLVYASSCENQIPAYNGNASAITSSESYSSSYPAWQAFDGAHSSMWISQVWQTPAWIGYEFDYPKTINSYTIDYANGSITTRAPKDFRLEGSNNQGWVILDVRSNETNWAGSEKRTYSVSNPGSYKKYRLYVTDDNDDRSGIVVISIGELSLESCSCNFSSEQVPVLSGNSASVGTSGVYSSSYPAWKAFDSSLASMWISEVWETPAWVSYQWSTPRLINQYSIHYSNGSITTRAPKDWKLQGWNGSSWVTVDTRYNQTNWSGSETRSYTVASPGSYIKYQLLISDDNDSRSGIVVISMGNLSLRGCER